MKNEIDEILNSMFSGGKLNVRKSKAAEDAEEFLKSINESNNKIGESLRRQIDNLSEINEAAKADLADMEKHLESDGLKEAPKAKEKPKAVHGSEKTNRDFNTVFAELPKLVADRVIGQDDFLRKLILAFKRPFVMGKEEGKPASSIIITGKTGTGRHSALVSLVEELGNSGVLKNGNIVTMDLSIYPTNAEARLFVQDLYSALESDAAVILFENYDKCHKSLLTQLTDLVLEGSLRLSTRYVEQKGMLVDAGTALVPGAVSSLNCDGQYLVFMTNNNQGKIADTMGAAFINGVSDICMTSPFAPESLTLIGKKEWEELTEKARRILGFSLMGSDEIPVLFASKFTLADGVNSIGEFSAKCYKALSEYKLNSSAGDMEFVASIESDELKFSSGEIIITVGSSQSSHYQSAIDEVKAQMDDIIGLGSVKEYIFSLEENYRVNLMRRQKGLKTDAPSMHMIFTGNPGTGKTTIARLVSRYLKAIGVLSGGQLIEVTRADLVGRFVGHTAPLTRQVIESAIGGVLFIDEAYSLYRGSDDSFGLEAIDTLVKGMEDNRDNLLVILAGYSHEMQKFLESNSGLKSRFPNIIEFPDYSARELLDISKITVRNKGYVLDPECDGGLLDYFDRKQRESAGVSGNGRLARNLIEKAIINQSKRIIAEKTEDLSLLKLCDFDLV